MIPGSAPPPAPAPVAGDDPTRVGGRRLAACAVDVAIGVALYVVLFALLSRQAPAVTWVGRGTNMCVGRRLCASFGHRYIDGWRRAVMQLGLLAYLVGVFVLQRGLTGSTLGTRLTGLVVVGHDGQPIGPLRALWRSVAGIVDYVPCCVPLVGIITMFATTGHRRVGDMAARSLVVPRDRLGAPILVPGLGLTPASAPAAPVTPVTPAPTPPATASAGPSAPSAPFADAPPWASATPPASPPSPPTTPTGPVDASTSGAVAPSPAAPPDPTQPHWDRARGAYLQWDQVGQRWMQYDQDSQSWRPLA